MPTVTRLQNFGSIYFLSNGTGADSISFGAGIFHLALIVLHVTYRPGKHKGGGGTFSLVTNSFKNDVKRGLQLRAYFAKPTPD